MGAGRSAANRRGLREQSTPQASEPLGQFAPQFQHLPNWPSLTSLQFGHVQPGCAGPAGSRAWFTSRFASSTFDGSTTHSSGHASVGGTSPARKLPPSVDTRR